MRELTRLLRAALLALLVSLVACPIAAQTAVPQPVERPADAALSAGRLPDWLQTLDGYAAALADSATTPADLLSMRTALDALRAAADGAKLRLKALATEKQGLLAALGPPPADGTPEAMAITAQRGQLSTDLNGVLDQLKQLDLVSARAQALIDRIDKLQQQLLAQELGHRGPSPFDAMTWRLAGPQMLDLGGRLLAAPPEWADRAVAEHHGRPGALASSWATFAALVLALALFARMARRRWGRARVVTPRGKIELYRGAVVDGLAKTVFPIAVLQGALALATSQGLVFGLFGALFAGAADAASFGLLYLGLVDLAVAPSRPAWRLYPLVPVSARRLRRRVRLLVLLLFCALWMSYGFAGEYLIDRELEALLACLFGLALASIMFALTSTRLWHRDHSGEARPVSRVGLILLWILRLLIIVGGLSLLFGYYPFARFLLGGTLRSYALLFAYDACRHVGRHVIATLATSDRPGLVSLRRNLGFADDMRIARLWLGWLLDCTLFAWVAVSLLLFWGVPWPVIFDRLRQLLFGFSIGDIRLSLVDMLAAICVVVLCVVATNAVKRWLQDTVLPQTRLDLGVQNSIVSGGGYVGYVLAAIFGFSALGLNLSNIAIIAGALSVGIGFGLQNIVNNFVSGLILLIERPIKVGDWVVVGSTEGVVRSISVRATEVETFRRASLIIPNSEFISKQVMNWTHRSKQGRADVRLTVAYGSDVERVRDILLAIYGDHPEIVAYPAPSVLFEDFGDTALVFSARGYIDDVDRRSLIESELRFQIYKAFAAAGIQTPSGPSVTVFRQEGPPAPI